MEFETQSAAAAADVVAGEIDPKLRLDFYRRMLRIRLVEEAIADRYAEQEMRCPVHLSIGQEAIAVGVCARSSSGTTS